jgi:hypothetical protein
MILLTTPDTGSNASGVEVYVVDSLGDVGAVRADVKEERHSPLRTERHRELARPAG